MGTNALDAIDLVTTTRLLGAVGVLCNRVVGATLVDAEQELHIQEPKVESSLLSRGPHPTYLQLGFIVSRECRRFFCAPIPAPLL